MGELRFAKQVSRTVAHSILKDFVEHYVDKEKLRKYGLMWNSFAQKPQCIPMDRIQDISMPSDDRVFFYDERGKSLYVSGWWKPSGRLSMVLWNGCVACWM